MAASIFNFKSHETLCRMIALCITNASAISIELRMKNYFEY